MKGLEDDIFGNMCMVGCCGTQQEGKECLKNFYKNLKKYIVPSADTYISMIQEFGITEENRAQSNFLIHMDSFLRIKAKLMCNNYTGVCTTIFERFLFSDFYNPEVYNALSTLLLECI